MSKHSKWAKVKHYKGAADAKRAAVFTKLARAITVAAREGGGDPAFNFRLRAAIDSALAQNMPKDSIERAVKKGTGEIAGEKIETVLYEGFGPGGAAILAEALTDNRNRTSSGLKHLFSAHGGNLASAGAVQWMFERKGAVRLDRQEPLGEAAELELIDSGAEDIRKEGEETVVIAAPDALAKLRTAAERLGLKVSSSALEWIPKEKAPTLDEETKAKLEELLDALDENEDVNAIYFTT